MHKNRWEIIYFHCIVPKRLGELDISKEITVSTFLEMGNFSQPGLHLNPPPLVDLGNALKYHHVDPPLVNFYFVSDFCDYY